MAFSPNKPGGGLHRPLADINVTPLVDVMLVLLIVFMITAPIMTAGLKVNLPQAKSAQTLKPKMPIVVSITREGKYGLGTDEMDMDGLLANLQSRMEGDLSRVIQIRGDKDAAYSSVISLVDRLVSNGITHLALISDGKAPKNGVSKPAVNVGTVPMRPTQTP